MVDISNRKGHKKQRHEMPYTEKLPHNMISKTSQRAHEQLVNHTSLKIRPRCYVYKVTHWAGHVSANTQASSASLRWPGDGDCYIFHAQSVVRWLPLSKRSVKALWKHLLFMQLSFVHMYPIWQDMKNKSTKLNKVFTNELLHNTIRKTCQRAQINSEREWRDTVLQICFVA